MISQALFNLRPGETWYIKGDELYRNIVWTNPDTQIPSEQEVAIEVERIAVNKARTEYQRQRRPEYPPMTDYLDAVYWQSQGDNTKMTAYLAAVEAVKSKYPKENI